MFKGLYTSLITPFDENNRIDIESLSHLIAMQIDAKVNGIVLLGTSGEGMTISTEEREMLIRHVVEVTRRLETENTDKKIQIIIGTGSNCTKTTIENSIQAAKLGADGIMVVTPYYNKPSQEGLYQHYKAVNDAINIPMMIYNVPSRTAMNVDDATLMRLIELTNVYSIKDYDTLRPIRLYIDWYKKHEIKNRLISNEKNLTKDSFIENSIHNYELFKAACTSNFTILAGDDVNSLSIYTNGGSGCVSVAANILPGVCRELHDIAQTGHDMNRARSIHAYLHPIYNALFCETNPVPAKYIAYKMGYIKTPNVRLPLCEISQENKTMIDNLLQQYKLI